MRGAVPGTQYPRYYLKWPREESHSYPKGCLALRIRISCDNLGWEAVAIAGAAIILRPESHRTFPTLNLTLYSLNIAHRPEKVP
jgi:hypothetical protein